MTKFFPIGVVLVSLSHALTSMPAKAQEVHVIPGVAAAQEGAANAAPSWQAICGYKWRQYRQATGASGRDAYYAFMRTPSAEGGCGAGETTRTRAVRANPMDEKIKEYIAEHSKPVAPVAPAPQQ